jgi:serine/threonine-protein kinase
MICPTCTTDLPENADVCPRCSTPLTDVTHLSGDAVTTGARDRSVRPARTKNPTTSSSWLSSSGAIDHGRFAPGTLLEGRYRVVGRLGRGGMGEVYRADDLKLGQPVALKFLPEAVDQDPARLTQLHAEVRMARQVSHPNVCRVYDVGEFEGHTFLSMEYVDGEDLSSLLRRIGRFSQDRGLELARQICAGLAAAHDRGVVHRDLKPANIMLDGSGRIRITDFGLAGATGETLRAGTPAYMAPEQLAGGEVTPRSDLYALGLVLYEIFTGHRALEGNNIAELIAKREQAGITRPTEVVRDLDSAIEHGIMRCLEPDPVNRPTTALAVAAALPGGDPLAAALAAGETPSPEMVAASGETSALRPLAAIAAFGTVVVLMLATVALSDRVLLTSTIPLPKPPVLLAERSKDILRAVGYASDAADAGQAFSLVTGIADYLEGHPEHNTPERLRSGTPAVLQFWYRGSPSIMLPLGMDDRVSITNPPLTTPGMTLVKLDPQGRLLELEVIPSQAGAAAKPVTPDWRPLFEAAGLDIGSFTPVTPEWIPRQYADVRAAWTGPLPGISNERLRVEAASQNGRPVYFQQIAPWTPPPRTATPGRDATQPTLRSAIVQVIVLSIFAAAALFARHNVRQGRGDRRGAVQLAVLVSVIALVVWVLDAKHYANPSIESSHFFVAQPLWAAGLLWMLYLAVEPYVRRFWPTTVVSWSRLMARKWRDPLVGRDILLGVAIGLLVHLIYDVRLLLIPRLGYSISRDLPDLNELMGTHIVIARVLNNVFNAMINAIFTVFALVLLKIVIRREMLAVAVAIAAGTAALGGAIYNTGPVWLNMLSIATMVGIVVVAIQRLGLLAMTVMFFILFTVGGAVLTFDTSHWFFADATVLALIPTALAFYGFYASRGGEPLFGRRLLD